MRVLLAAALCLASAEAFGMGPSLNIPLRGPRAASTSFLSSPPLPLPSGRRGSIAKWLAKLQTGIVGLPNVGKSTLFNALLQKQTAEAANFPFCTIEPNTGIVSVPDPRLDVLGKISESEKIIAATMEFVDIAGIVKGASEGAGLGNKFLANIRECDAICHVVRCFENDDVIHVDGSVDPVRDMEVINLELIFADLAQAEKRMERLVKDVKNKKEGAAVEMAALEKIKEGLEKGLPARSCDLSDEERAAVKGLGMLTLKKMIYATNVADADLAEGNPMVDKVKECAEKEGASVVVVSAQVESEMAELDAADKAEFLEALGIDDPNSTGLNALVKSAYQLLGLQTYFTTGPTETRAWTITKGTKAPQAAGVIHQDFERGFIRAETVSYKDLVEAGSEQACKAAGTWRSEGKDYEVQDGDSMLFRFNV
mmetsp:Transcript_5845/g.14979  ORF Transcript_5845/g.14979 Transcript_5845/m.14979 type:complete len:426 (-) Transcript_5845:111-1388(-)